MKDIKIHCYWNPKIELKTKKQVDLYIDNLSVFDSKEDSIKILLLCEPDDIQHLNATTIANHKLVDFILTFDEQILSECENARLFEYGTSWIKDYTFPKKHFSLSHLTGFKTWTTGHLLRQKIWYKQNKITIPKNFYLSRTNEGVENYVNAPVLGDSKDPLFESQFHLTIENVKKNNYFSEKIIDCFQTKTIPVYCGCENIGDYFNTDGIIIVNDFENIIKTVNNLTEDDYLKRHLAIEENFELSKKFISIEERITQKIKELINEDIN